MITIGGNSLERERLGFGLLNFVEWNIYPGAMKIPRALCALGRLTFTARERCVNWHIWALIIDNCQPMPYNVLVLLLYDVKPCLARLKRARIEEIAAYITR